MPAQTARPDLLVDVLAYALKRALALDWRTVDETGRELADCNAFCDAGVPRHQDRPPPLPERMVGTPLRQKRAERPRGASLDPETACLQRGIQ